MLLMTWWLWTGGNFKSSQGNLALMPDTTTVISSPLGSPHCQDHKNTQFANLVFPSCAPPRSFLLHLLHLIACLFKTPSVRNLFGIGLFSLLSTLFFMVCQSGSGMPFCCGLLPLMSTFSERGYMVSRPHWI